MYDCEYCCRSFNRNTSLTRHQSTAKYCLDIQKAAKQTTYTCGYCKKQLSLGTKNSKHLQTCTVYDQRIEYKAVALQNEDIHRQLKVKDEQIRELQRQIQELAMLAINHRTPVQNRNNIVLNNLEPLTDEKLETLAIDHLTIDDLKRGVEGLIEIFSSNYPVRGSVVCTDKSRKKLCFREEDGTVIDDPGGAKLSQKFFSAIKPRYSELINQEYANITERVQDIVKRNRAVEENVVELMQEATALQNFKSECDIAAEGGANELRNDFVTRLVQTLN